MVVMGHHPQRLGPEPEDPGFSLTADSSAALDDVFERRPSIVAYTAGHTHRHRVRRAGGGMPSIEVGCVKDFPGTWAEYQVYDGGILQIVHRISSPRSAGLERAVPRACTPTSASTTRRTPSAASTNAAC